MSARVYRLMVLAAALLASGCASTSVSLSVKAPPGTNLGRPMYMLVREVDTKQYANEAYSEVAAKVGAPDHKVLQTAVIYPGTIQRFQVKAPKDGAVAVSFLFTAPDGNRSVIGSSPSLCRIHPVIHVLLTPASQPHPAPADGSRRRPGSPGSRA